MKAVSLAILSLLITLSLLSASPRHREGEAKITKNEAEHIALKRQEGARVTSARLETVAGKLVWSIEISRGPHLRLVAVDALSGRILSVRKGDR